MILRADSISKGFEGQRVLASAQVGAERGEVVGLLGRMGTGKSTLLKICAGVLQPDSGWVELEGRRYERPQLSELASRGLFYLAEQHNLVRDLPVKRHFDLIEKRFGPGDRDFVVDFLGLKNFLDAPAHTLSTGESRRVEMAMAILRRPLCLLTDEPLRSVDPLMCDLLGKAFRHLSASGCAVVVTGHEVNALRPYLDSVVWVTNGTTYPLGTTDAAWKHEAFKKEYLGPDNK